MARKSLNDAKNGTDWKPEVAADGAPKMTANANDYIEGYLMKKKENVGMHNSNVYEIQISESENYSGFGSDGDVVNVWGSTVINQLMDHVRIGQWIRVEYKGKKLKKASEKKHPQTLGMNDYVKMFDVIVDDEIADIAVSGAPAYKPAAVTAPTANYASAPSSLEDPEPIHTSSNEDDLDF
jgi:hypothetical protein